MILSENECDMMVVGTLETMPVIWAILTGYGGCGIVGAVVEEVILDWSGSMGIGIVLISFDCPRTI